MKFVFIVLSLILLVVLFFLAYIFFMTADLNPEKRFRKNALMCVNIIVPIIYLAYIKITTKDGALVDDLILNINCLDSGKIYYIGRVVGNTKIKRMPYFIENKELFYGINCGVRSGMPERFIKLELYSQKNIADELLVSLDESACNISAVNEYRYGDKPFEPLDYTSCLVFEKVWGEIHSQDYIIKFKMLSSNEYLQIIDDYILRHKKLKAKKN